MPRAMDLGLIVDPEASEVNQGGLMAPRAGPAGEGLGSGGYLSVIVLDP